MQRLNKSQLSFLWETALRYRNSLPGSRAEEHLIARGLDPADPKVAAFGLGAVTEPARGHEQYLGCLAIPYLRRSPLGVWSVVSIRFRCLQDHEHHGHGKYMTVAGDRSRLFNTAVLLEPSATMSITEGEICSMTAQISGIPAVGVPGASNWKTHFSEPFLGYREVFILADGDEPGLVFANTVAKTLPNAKVIPMPRGSDVNSFVKQHGPQALKEKLK